MLGIAIGVGFFAALFYAADLVSPYLPHFILAQCPVLFMISFALAYEGLRTGAVREGTLTRYDDDRTVSLADRPLSFSLRLAYFVSMGLLALIIGVTMAYMILTSLW